MDALRGLEHTVLGWFKDVPHLPESARKLIADNVWWVVAIVTAVTAIYVLSLIFALFDSLAVLASPFVAYYTSASVVAWTVVQTSISLVFAVLEVIILGSAIKPLRAGHRKGWMLLFGSLLLGVVSVVLGAVLTLSPFSFITNLIFGLLWTGIAAYFIFEIHGQFTHTDRPKGVKTSK